MGPSLERDVQDGHDFQTRGHFSRWQFGSLILEIRKKYITKKTMSQSHILSIKIHAVDLGITKTIQVNSARFIHVIVFIQHHVSLFPESALPTFKKCPTHNL
jgi:hypothetical protein